MGDKYYEVSGSEKTAFLNHVSDSDLRLQGEAESARSRNWFDPPDWPKIRLKTITSYHGKSLKRLDIECATRGLVCSPKAFDILSPMLQQGGVILPVDVDGGNIWRYFLMDSLGDNVPHAKVLAKGKVRRNHADLPKPLPRTPVEGIIPWRRKKHDGADFINWYELDPESIDGRDVFYGVYSYSVLVEGVRPIPNTKTFVSERFVKAVLEAGLQGLVFHETTKPDDPAWQPDLTQYAPWH